MKRTIAALMAVLLACMAFSACLTVTADSEVPKKTLNVARGAKYVTSDLFRQNDAWQWSEDAEIAYPDTDGVELTDGKFPQDNATHYDGAFFGFRADSPDYVARGYAYLRVDLGRAFDLSSLVLYVGTRNLGDGIYAPETVAFYAVGDMDGSDPVEIGTVHPGEDDTVPYIPCVLETEATARFIEIRVTAANWLFVTEFEAYTSNVMMGDLNGDGMINSTDYLVMKRHVLGTFRIPEGLVPLADINHDGKINAIDCMFVKRATTGAFVIVNPFA